MHLFFHDIHTVALVAQFVYSDIVLVSFECWRRGAFFDWRIKLIRRFYTVLPRFEGCALFLEFGWEYTFFALLLVLCHRFFRIIFFILRSPITLILLKALVPPDSADKIVLLDCYCKLLHFLSSHHWLSVVLINHTTWSLTFLYLFGWLATLRLSFKPPEITVFIQFSGIHGLSLLWFVMTFWLFYWIDFTP